MTCRWTKGAARHKEKSGGLMKLVNFGRAESRKHNKKYLDGKKTIRRAVYQAKCETDQKYHWWTVHKKSWWYVGSHWLR